MREFSMKRSSSNQGSITIYLCLVLSVLLSLIFVGLHSACIAAGRTALASGLEQGLYSLFAGYDREMFDTYGLLFMDGGYGTGDLKLEEIYREVQEAAEAVVDPDRLLDIKLERGSLDGYILATDQGGAAFRRQICAVMEKKLGISGIQLLSDTLEDQFGIMKSQEQQKEQAGTEEAECDYEEQKKTAAETAEEREQERKDVEVPPDFENPIEVIQKVRKLGILGLVISDISDLSGYTLGNEELLEDRELQQGMGVVSETKTGLGEKLLLLEYLSEFFPCYTSGEQREGLRYQIEYAIGGKRDDMENLKSVVYRLLAVREASNLMYLCGSPARCAEADEMALIISTILFIPEAYALVSFVLKICWAYGESILDIRELLDGGKIPLLKDDTSWQLSLNSLSGLLIQGDEERHSSEGLDYQWYLRLLLLMKDEDSLTRSLMNLTEYNMRIQGGNPGFCLDTCVESASVTLSARIRSSSFSITRSYGYDMDQ